MSSSKKFEEGLSRQYETAADKHTVDVTVYLQMMFENTDRHIAKAVINDGKSLVLQIGMRSEILSPFPKYKDDKIGCFNQCDIIGLVPLVSLMVEQKDKMVTASAIERDDTTKAILVFDAVGLDQIARKVWRFMERWDRWIDVLLGVLNKDIHFEIDWREFLAGESGYITMDWYKPLDYDSRAIALHRVKLATRALLQSVLSRAHFENYLMKELTTWLDHLHPQITVQGAYREMIQEEIF